MEKDFTEFVEELNEQHFGRKLTPSEEMADWEERHGGWDED